MKITKITIGGNQFTQESAFEHADWAKAELTVSANATTDPDGTSTADKLVESVTASAMHAIGQAGSSAAGQTIVLSVYAKAAGQDYIILSLYGQDAVNYGVAFNLSTGAYDSDWGTAPDSYSITDQGSGWYHCTIRLKMPSGGGSAYARFRLYNGSSAYYTGDGSSGVYVWKGEMFADWALVVPHRSISLDFPTGLQIGVAAFQAWELTGYDLSDLEGKNEVIFYSGAKKVWGGYIGTIGYGKDGKRAVATVKAQSYAVLLKDTTVTAEEVYSGTDEAALGDLFTTYLPAISTAAVNTVESSLELTVPASTTMRRAVELILDRTGAEAWVDVNKLLQYVDPATDPSEAPFALRETAIVLADSDNPANYTLNATWSDGLLTEDSTVAVGHLISFNGLTITNGRRYVFSVEVKSNGRNWIALDTDANSFNWAFYDLLDGDLGTVNATVSAEIIALGDDWYRLLYGFPATSGGTKQFRVLLGEADQDFTYDGDGASGAYIRNIYVADGHQIIDPFEFTRDVSRLCNDCEVKSASGSGPPGSLTVEIATSADDAETIQESTGAEWPPAGTKSVDTNSNVHIQSGYHTGGSLDHHYNGFFRFDTSGLPDSCTITSAKIRVYISAGEYEAIGSVAIEYYASANWPITTVDHTNTPSTTAGNPAWPSTYPGEWLEWTLTSPDANISKTGMTGFRIMTKWSSAPSAGIHNSLTIYNSTGTQGKDIQLIIEYDTTPWSGSDSDATSIAAYGSHKRPIIDKAISSDAEADLRAAVEVARDKDPHESGSATLINVDGLEIGKLLAVEHPTFDADASYLIRKLRISWKNGATVYRCEFGEHRPDVLRLLRLLDQTREEGGS